jgi:periplasmic copper chaperone A
MMINFLRILTMPTYLHKLLVASVLGLAFAPSVQAQHAQPHGGAVTGGAASGAHGSAGHGRADQATVTLGRINIIGPWSRATPGSAKVAGGFFTLNNQGEPDSLMSAAAPEIAGRVEMHETTLNDGIMRMREKEGGIPLPSNGTTQFKPGGLHVMFMDLKRPLKAGERFKAELVFAKAGKITVEFTVRAMGEGDSTNH